MNEAEKVIDENSKETGYNKIFCNPKNFEKLSKKFPKLTLTETNYVEENQIIFANIPILEVENE